MQKLIEEFKKMPGIGPKSAQRLAFYILSLNSSGVDRLAQALKEVKEKMKYCSTCYNITMNDPCEICSSPERDRSTICIVAEPKDLIAIERTKEYKGLYHVLGGVISPVEGIGPESLHIKELLRRLKGEVKEVVLATNPTVEGETTNTYLTKLIRPLGIKLTRLALGLPMGADMDYADEVTLSKAFEGRREI